MRLAFYLRRGWTSSSQARQVPSAGPFPKLLTLPFLHPSYESPSYHHCCCHLSFLLPLVRVPSTRR